MRLATSIARFASSREAEATSPMICAGSAGLRDAIVFCVAMRSPAITSGYSRPNSLRTSPRAASILAASAGSAYVLIGSFLKGAMRSAVMFMPP